jgi:hypothetical protein
MEKIILVDEVFLIYIIIPTTTTTRDAIEPTQSTGVQKQSRVGEETSIFHQPKTHHLSIYSLGNLLLSTVRNCHLFYNYSKYYFSNSEIEA